MSGKAIELAFEQLPPSDIAELSEWLAEYLAQARAKQWGGDVHVGCLDSLLEKPAESHDGKELSPNACL
jgi:DNA-binding FadR family transcriptional regulator